MRRAALFVLLAAVLGGAARTARGDVKAVAVRVGGATCPT